MASAIRRKAFRSHREEIPKTEAFQFLSTATKKGRRAIRRVVLKKG